MATKWNELLTFVDVMMCRNSKYPFMEREGGRGQKKLENEAKISF